MVPIISGRHRIPVRNIWLLLLYASDLFRHIDSAKRYALEDNPDDIPDLVAEILAHEVERRLARNLSLGWQSRKAVVNRVRGRIDHRYTETRLLLERGKVACRFDELTIDTPRNRFVRAALAKLAGIIGRPELARRCRSLSARLERLGVSAGKPAQTEVSISTFGRFDANDRFMVAAAQLAFDLALPNEEPGGTALTAPSHEIHWLRLLFEKAVAGFYSVTLSHIGWHITHGKRLRWPQDKPTPGIESILPSMKTDILLEHRSLGHRVVIDTKFTDILTSGHYRAESLRSAYIYQIYSYLRSQENDSDPMASNATGVLLHPAVAEMVDEAVVIQGHSIRFATVDLAAKAIDIRQQLLAMTDPHPSHITSPSHPMTLPA